MCTVTYLPLENNNYIITSNRDEQVVRKTIFPHLFESTNFTLLGPRDEKAGGTWIATSNQNMTACLLNGAFEKHISKPPYRQSRGKVVTDVFQYKNVHEFTANYDFSGIENFTLVLAYNNQNRPELYELRWDGEVLHKKELDRSQPYIWASATLYAKEVVIERKEWFKTWVNENDFNLENIRNFHQFGGNGDKTNGLQIKRNLLQTVSITSVLVSSSQSDVHYFDMINKNTAVKSIKLLSLNLRS